MGSVIGQRYHSNLKQNGGDITVRLISNFKSLISEGTYGPGSKLPPERVLARQFGVNRSSLRQALKVLQLMGVVSQRVGDGTYLNADAKNILREPVEFMVLLADISDDELFDARIIVESELAARAAERARSEDLAALRRAIKAMERCPTDRARIDADLAFHEAIFRASGNRVCRLIFAAIHRAVATSMARIVRRADVRRPLAFHKAIYSAIERGRPRDARRLMAEHLLDAKSQMLSTNPSPTHHRPTKRVGSARPRLELTPSRR